MCIRDRRMAELAKNTMITSLSLIKGYDQAKADEVAEHEELVDKYEDRIGEYLVQVASRDLSSADSETVTLLDVYKRQE